VQEQQIATKLPDAAGDTVVPIVSFVVVEDALEVVSVVGSAIVTAKSSQQHSLHGQSLTSDITNDVTFLPQTK